MKKTVCIVLCVFALLAVLLGGALHGFEKVALDPTRYDRIQAELNIYDSVGMDADALSRVNELLTNYLSRKTDDLFIEEEVFGVRQQVFNEDEKAHMVDVVNLFSLAHMLKLIFFIGGAVLFLMACLCVSRDFQQVIRQGIRWSVIAIGAGAVLCTAAVMLFGFDTLFIGFHYLFFTNDLWLMDPSTDIMIRMFPGEFFERIVSQICGNMFSSCIGASLIVEIPLIGIVQCIWNIRSHLSTHRRKQKS